MVGASNTGNSRNTIVAIIAIVVAAIAIIAVIVAVALGGSGAKGSSSGSSAKPARTEELAVDEGGETSIEDLEEKIVGRWSNASFGGGGTALLSGVDVKADGTAHRFENGTQGADYRWEARSDGSYVFTDYYGLDGGETFVTIDDNDQLHWDDSHVFTRDEREDDEASSSSSSSSSDQGSDSGASSDQGSDSSASFNSQASAEQDIVGQWYYDIDPTGSGGAARPMYYALDVLEDGTATLTYNGMSYAEYSWEASGDGWDFTKTHQEGGGYAESAHACIAENDSLEWSGDESGMLFVRVE